MILSLKREVNIAENLAQNGIPTGLLQWLSKLKLLYGIPFSYLVPDNDFLPPETIRFFYLDPDWIASLADGALSIGRHYNGFDHPPATLHSDLVHHDLIHLKTDENLHNIRRLQLSMEIAPVPLNEPDVSSGFLLNSAVVKGWKSIDVAGYPKGFSPYDYVKDNKVKIQSLNILRLERLSPTVMMGIFQGSLYELVLHQPPEAIHFGFQQVFDDASKQENSVTKNLRVPTTNWDDPETGYDTDKYQNKTLDNAFVNADERVLDMTQLSKGLAAQLAAVRTNGAPGYYRADPPDGNFKDHLVASDFALEMVQGVGLVSFINE